MKRVRGITRRRFLSVAIIAATGAAATACQSGVPTPKPEPTQAPVQATKAPAQPTTAAKPTAAPPTAVPAAKYKEAPKLADLVKAGQLPAVEKRLPEKPMFVKPIEQIGVYGGAWKLFVIRLRTGLMWSDGQPFTADDVMFWWEDIVGNDELTPVKPYWMFTASRKLGTVVKIDDVTVAFKFPESHGMFIAYLTKKLSQKT